MYDALETLSKGKCSASLYMDEDARDPRPDTDQLGTMVCWHPDYALGDFQVTNPYGRGAVETRFERDDFKSLQSLVRWLELCKRATVILPLYLYDHSGITMSVGHKGDFAFDTAGWDTSDVGVIFTTPERVAELCGDKRYTPADFQGTHEKWIAEQLSFEVAEYDNYLTGSVYGYVVKDETGEERDSLWNLMGYDFAVAEMRSALKEAAKDRKAERRVEKAERAGVHVDVFPSGLA